VSDGIIYNSDGMILRIVSTPDDQLSLQVQAGEFLLSGTADSLTQYINSSGIVTNFPTQPTINHIWNWSTKAWELPPILTTSNSWSATTLAANGTATVTFGSSLPNPTNVSVVLPPDVAAVTISPVTDGVFSFSTVTPGSYVFTFVAEGYLSHTQTITATV